MYQSHIGCEMAKLGDNEEEEKKKEERIREEGMREGPRPAGSWREMRVERVEEPINQINSPFNPPLHRGFGHL